MCEAPISSSHVFNQIVHLKVQNQVGWCEEERRDDESDISDSGILHGILHKPAVNPSIRPPPILWGCAPALPARSDTKIHTKHSRAVSSQL